MKFSWSRSSTVRRSMAAGTKSKPVLEQRIASDGERLWHMQRFGHCCPRHAAASNSKDNHSRSIILDGERGNWKTVRSSDELRWTIKWWITGRFFCSRKQTQVIFGSLVNQPVFQFQHSCLLLWIWLQDIYKYVWILPFKFEPIKDDGPPKHNLLRKHWWAMIEFALWSCCSVHIN